MSFAYGVIIGALFALIIVVILLFVDFHKNIKNIFSDFEEEEIDVVELSELELKKIDLVEELHIEKARFFDTRDTIKMLKKEIRKIDKELRNENQNYNRKK